MIVRSIAAAFVVAVVTGCASDAGVPSPMAPLPTFDRTVTTLVVKPSSLSLTGAGSANAKTAIVSERGYTKKIAERSNCRIVASIKPAYGIGPKFKVTITPIAPGSCTFSFVDLLGHKAKLAIKVSAPSRFREYALPNAGSAPYAIVAGPDNALWFTEESGNRIGRILTDGTIKEWAIPTHVSQPMGIVAGPDGALWFTEYASNKLGRITTTGTVSETPVTAPHSGPTAIASYGGSLWFTEFCASNIGGYPPGGAITEFSTTTPLSGPWAIATGNNGVLWFTERYANKIGSVTQIGLSAEYAIPTQGSNPGGIVQGPDQQLWFVEQDAGNIAHLGLSH